MKTLNRNNQEKVLKILIDMPKNKAGYIYKPINFKNYFPFVTNEALIVILATLKENNLITLEETDAPECFNIEYISITEKGYHFIMEINHTHKKELIQFIIPVSISLVALLKSFQSEIILLWQLIKQILK